MNAGSMPFGSAEVVVVLRAGEPSPFAPGRAGGVRGRHLLEREVEHLRQAAVADERREVDGVVQRHLAEDREVADPGRARRGADLRHPELEERGVHVLRGVDPEPVDVEARDPGRVDLREAVHHVRLLREQVVEPEEVALLEALLAARAEVDVAAVVVVERVVQPGRLLQVAVRLQEQRHLRHVRGLQAGESSPVTYRAGLKGLPWQSR